MTRTKWSAAATLMVLITLSANAHGQRVPPEISVSNPVVYEVTISTTFTVPDNGKKLTRLAVWHALPNARPWDGLERTLGASAITYRPDSGRVEHLGVKASQHVLWEFRQGLETGKTFEFVSRFRVRSADRAFDLTKCAAKWADYGINYDRTVLPPRQPTVELAAIADKIKNEHPPAQAALEFCKWITGHVQYDASVPYYPNDLAAIMRHARGHCGHQMALFEAMCARVGIPTKVVVGLNLNTPDGIGDLHKIRPDYLNQHTWAEIYLPGSGWVEIDPGMGSKAYYITAQLIQNNSDFQNYVVWLIEDGQSKMPDWEYRDGKWFSPYGVENRRTFRRIDPAGLKRG